MQAVYNMLEFTSFPYYIENRLSKFFSVFYIYIVNNSFSMISLIYYSLFFPLRSFVLSEITTL